MQDHLKTAAVVSLGRSTASGETRRVDSLFEILDLAGVAVHKVSLLPRHRTKFHEVAKRLPALYSPDVVPETLAWSPASLMKELKTLRPDLVICVTARSFQPIVTTGPWITIIDYVDRLSESYSLRRAITSGPFKPTLYRFLSHAMERFEASSHHGVATTLAAGWRDAALLGATWIPVTVFPRHLTFDPDSETTVPDKDVLFIGNLAYPPNVAAVSRLGTIWSQLQQHRPQVSALIAGANPTAQVRALALAHGWELMPNFEHVGDVCKRARLAVVPLAHATGMQSKILEAAAYGVAQVVHPASLNGFQPGFPAVSANSNGDFVKEIVYLLENERARQHLAEQARKHVIEKYDPASWVQTAKHLFE